MLRKYPAPPCRPQAFRVRTVVVRGSPRWRVLLFCGLAGAAVLLLSLLA